MNHRGEISPKVEEFKERIRAKYPRRKEPNFRIPWYVLVVNMLLIAYILYIYGQKPSDEPYSTTLQYEGVEYHLSIIKDTTSGEKIAHLTVRNLHKSDVTILFNNRIASLEFCHGKNVVDRGEFGQGINSLVVGNGEMKTFVMPISLNALFEYAKKTDHAIVNKRKSLFTVEHSYFPFTARFTIHTRVPVITIFEYRIYEVK